MVSLNRFLEVKGLDYENGLRHLKQRLGNEDDYMVFESRLRDCMERERLYGPNENTRSIKAEIVDSLNQLAMNRLGISFNELCDIKLARVADETKPELAHVLFTDIVGFGPLSHEYKLRVRQLLQDSVQSTAEFTRAQATGEFIKRPTGDGVALVFFRYFTSPVECAMQLSRILKKDNNELKLRMGVHSGLITRVIDVNLDTDVSGDGIVLAQRVMDCGDAGHILISETVANHLKELGTWDSLLHDLGEIEVKHGNRIRVFNLYNDEVGNSELPKKFRAYLKDNCASTEV